MQDDDVDSWFDLSKPTAPAPAEGISLKVWADTHPVVEMVRAVYGDSMQGILVSMEQPDGETAVVGAIVLDPQRSANVHGAFVYAPDYAGVPLAPTLDYRTLENELKVFLLERPKNRNVRSEPDLHQVFLQSLPDEWGSKILEAHVPEYASAPASQRLLMLSPTTFGALHFNCMTNQHAPILSDDVGVMHDRITEFLSDRYQPFLKKVEQWAVYNNGGQQPKVSFKIEGENGEWIAKFDDGTGGDLVRNELMLSEVAKSAGLNVPNAVAHLTSSEDMVFCSERYDREEDGTSLHRISLAAVMGKGKFDYVEYVQLVDVLQQHSAEPDQDIEELFRRMALNALAQNTDTHMGQFELVYEQGGPRLAPAFDLQVTTKMGDDGRIPEHFCKFADGEGRPELSVAWFEKQADAFEIDRDRALDIVAKVAGAIQNVPEIMEKFGMDATQSNRILRAIRLDSVKRLEVEIVSSRGNSQDNSQDLDTPKVRGMRIR